MLRFLFILNALGALALVFLAPIAVHSNATYTTDRISELAELGVLNQENLESFAHNRNADTIAQNRMHLADWLTDASATNYYLVFPAFMILLTNTFLTLKLCINEYNQKPCSM